MWKEWLPLKDFQADFVDITGSGSGAPAPPRLWLRPRQPEPEGGVRPKSFEYEMEYSVSRDTRMGYFMNEKLGYNEKFFMGGAGAEPEPRDRVARAGAKNINIYLWEYTELKFGKIVN
jgi:hypothetical protein